MRNLLYFLICLLFISCHNIQDKQTLLCEAEALMDSVPQEALNKLESIKSIEALPEADQARFKLLRSKAMIKVGSRMPSPNTPLEQAIRYYQEQNDSTKWFEALYTKALSLFYYSKYDSALHYFTQSETLISNDDDSDRYTSIHRLSAICHLHLGKVEKAINNFHLVVERTSQSTDTLRKIHDRINLSQAYSVDKKSRQAHLYAQEAQSLALATEDKSIVSLSTKNLALLFEQEKDFQKALEYKEMEHDLRLSREDIPSLNLSKAILFDKLDQPDSTRHYLQLAIQGPDIFIADLAYKFLLSWYKKRGIYDKAFSFSQKRENSSHHLQSNIRMASLENQYEREILKNENNKLKIQQKERDILLLTISLVVLVILVVLFFLYWQQKKKREATRLQNKAKELERANLLLKQQKEISDLREKEALLRESLFHRIRFFNKIPSLKNGQKEGGTFCPKKGQRIIMTEQDWKELVQSVDAAYPNFSKQLREDYPCLSREDILFCCLLKIKVNLQDLSEIYCVTKAAITKRKYRIKTEKLKLSDKTIDLDHFLQDQY